VKKILLLLGCSIALFAGLSTTANAATFSWGPVGVGDVNYGLIATVNSTYSPGGTARIRLDMDNAHTVYVRYAPCGATPLDYNFITISAHTNAYYDLPQSFSNGACINFYARSALTNQTIWGYILA
jgi:hypothetical protein